MTTDKKNQHYIPKFYLRNFSYKMNKKQVGIYNLRTRFFFQTASLRDQGSKDFFYGEDGVVEDNLSAIETKLAFLINNIISSGELPRHGSEEHSVLLVFIALTHLRNPAIFKYLEESRLKMKDHVRSMTLDKDVDEYFPIDTKERNVSLAFSPLNSIIKVMTDLKYKLLRNNTSTPFLSSDFPVIKYNQFLEKKRWPFGKTGYGTIGVQIFIPLNPKLMLVFYDSAVYKVGSNKKNIFEITDIKDIDSLNELQILNCLETIYFNEEINEHYINQLVLRCKKYKRANQTKFNIMLPSENSRSKNPDRKESMVMMGVTECETKLNVNGIKIHSGSTSIKLTNAVAQYRPHADKIMNNSR